MKNAVIAFICALGFVIAAVVLGNSFINRNRTERTISVTGLGQTNFTSDLIVWEGRFTKENFNLQEAYSGLAADKNIVTEYLVSKGIKREQIVFNAVTTMRNEQPNYASNGNYIGTEFTGYTLSQGIKIESTDVEKIENLSREITELLNRGVQFYSDAPRYYYTKLEDLKVEMISQATENARLRAEKIAENAGAKLGDLIQADMGIFQITGQNSGEDYSWGGTLNTSSKKKTTSITMRLLYEAN